MQYLHILSLIVSQATAQIMIADTYSHNNFLGPKTERLELITTEPITELTKNSTEITKNAYQNTNITSTTDSIETTETISTYRFIFRFSLSISCKNEPSYLKIGHLRKMNDY